MPLEALSRALFHREGQFHRKHIAACQAFGARPERLRLADFTAFQSQKLPRRAPGFFDLSLAIPSTLTICPVIPAHSWQIERQQSICGDESLMDNRVDRYRLGFYRVRFLDPRKRGTILPAWSSIPRDFSGLASFGPSVLVGNRVRHEHSRSRQFGFLASLLAETSILRQG